MNELLFFLLAFTDLSFVLLCWYLGEEWVYASIVVNMLLIVSFAQKLIPVFGFVTNAGNVFYAATFLAMGIIIEHRGAARAYRMVWLGLLVLITFILFGQISIGFSTVSASANVSSAMDTIFSASPRVALASFLGYTCSQTFNIWCYDAIRKRTGAPHLWLRKNVSTWIAQLIDSVLFFVIVFYGVLESNQLVEILLVGLGTKILIAIMDTPFLYISQKISPIDDSSSHDDLLGFS